MTASEAYEKTRPLKIQAEKEKKEREQKEVDEVLPKILERIEKAAGTLDKHGNPVDFIVLSEEDEIKPEVRRVLQEMGYDVYRNLICHHSKGGIEYIVSWAIPGDGPKVKNESLIDKWFRVTYIDGSGFWSCLGFITPITIFSMLVVMVFWSLIVFASDLIRYLSTT